MNKDQFKRELQGMFRRRMFVCQKKISEAKSEKEKYYYMGQRAFCQYAVEFMQEMEKDDDGRDKS